MTKLLNAIKTYEQIDGHMVHDGYFILTNNYPLKWATKWQWQHISEKPTKFMLNIDGYVSRLKNAQ